MGLIEKWLELLHSFLLLSLIDVQLSGQLNPSQA